MVISINIERLMRIIKLEPLEYLDGIFSLIFVFITIIVACRIALKFMTFKQTVLITVGLSWIGIASMYLPPAINFLLLVTIGIPFNQFFYLSIYGFVPLTVFFWVISITYILRMLPFNLVYYFKLVLSYEQQINITLYFVHFIN